MSACLISPILTTTTLAGGLGLLVLGLIAIVSVLIAGRGERLETKMAG